MKGSVPLGVQHKSAWLRLVGSFRHAFRGVGHCWKTEPNFRIEVWTSLLVLGISVWLKANLSIVLLCCAVVLCLEMINTALEATIDLVTPEFHPLARVAKDVSAGSVLLAAMFSAIVGIFQLGPPLWHKIQSGG
ncbi:MAG: diacylglycerol kinase family protein [Deinococcaceae bacterium]